jgi:pimeloyl-ACP methyl ester carboxylesterase
MPIRSNASIRPASDEREVRGFIGPDSERTSYLTAGIVTGEPILLIHGTGMSARSWTNQLRGLAPALAVVAIDLPGHGESDPASEATVESYADAAGRLLDALGTGPVVVAGHSLGGAVALALAARHPELVKALVLISSCAKLPANNGSLERLFGSLPAPIRRFFFFSTSRKALFSLGAPMRAVQLGLKDLRSCRPETVRKDVAAAKAMDLEGVAQGLRVPALILWGPGHAYARRVV